MKRGASISLRFGCSGAVALACFAAQAQALPHWSPTRTPAGVCGLRVASPANAGAAGFKAACAALAARSWGRLSHADASRARPEDHCLAYDETVARDCENDAGVVVPDAPAWMRLHDAPTTHREIYSATGFPVPATFLTGAKVLRNAEILVWPPRKLKDGSCPRVPTVLSLMDTLVTPRACSAVLVGPSTFITSAHCVPAGGTVMYKRPGAPSALACDRHDQYEKAMCSGPLAGAADCAHDLAVCSAKDGNPFYEGVAAPTPESVAVAPPIKLTQQLWLAGFGRPGSEAEPCEPNPGVGPAPVYRLARPDAPRAIDRLLHTGKVSEPALEEMTGLAAEGDSGGAVFDAEPLLAGRRLVAVIAAKQAGGTIRRSLSVPLADAAARCFLVRAARKQPLHRITGIDASANHPACDAP